MLHIIGGCGDEQFGCDEPTSPGPENNGVVGIDPAEIGLEVGESGSVTAHTLLPGGAGDRPMAKPGSRHRHGGRRRTSRRLGGASPVTQPCTQRTCCRDIARVQLIQIADYKLALRAPHQPRHQESRETRWAHASHALPIMRRTTSSPIHDERSASASIRAPRPAAM